MSAYAIRGRGAVENNELRDLALLWGNMIAQILRTI